MKGKFDAYVLWPLDKKVQNWLLDRSTARDFTIFANVNNVFVLFTTHSFTNSTVTKSDCIDRKKNVIKISGYFFAKRSIVKSRKQSRESEWDWAELGKLDCSQAVTAARCNLHLEPVRPKKSSESILSKTNSLLNHFLGINAHLYLLHCLAKNENNELVFFKKTKHFAHLSILWTKNYWALWEVI